MKPYWQSVDGAITVYHARFEDVLAAGAVPVDEVALIHDDPPYGVKLDTAMRTRGRSNGTTLTHGGNPIARDYPAIVGDEHPFAPASILVLDRRSVIWGGHLCSPALPRSTSWLTWDKREGSGSDDNGDDEMAWTNLGGPIRRFSHLWRGTCRASETGTMHLGPCQKPVALSLWIFQERAKLKPRDLVFVPHGGTGPDLPAARAMQLRLIWCDVEQWCCDTAIARLPEAPQAILERAKAFQLATRKAKPEAACGPLFGGAR